MILLSVLSLWAGWEKTQNAVLFSAEHIIESRLANKSIHEHCVLWDQWIEKTRVAPGQYERRPGYGDINSHDNYLGMALGAYICNSPFLTREIATALAPKGWAFNDTMKPYDIRGQLTPKDIVPIKIVAGWEFSPLEAAYASLDLCFGNSWNLKRARILIYENHEINLLNSLILSPCIFVGKQRMDYVRAGCGYHGQDSEICENLRKSEGAWKL